MHKGWCNNDYWSLCEDKAEVEQFTTLYGLAEYLPGYSIVGLKGWDNFILADQEDRYFLVPTVPLEQASLDAFSFPAAPMRLESDPRFADKIKWYVKPIRLGGDPSAKENMAWLSQDEHVQAVKWWNQFYYDTLAKQQKV